MIFSHNNQTTQCVAGNGSSLKSGGPGRNTTNCELTGSYSLIQ